MCVRVVLAIQLSDLCPCLCALFDSLSLQRFVSLDYRPIVGSLAGAFWNIYISSKANGQIPAADLATSSVAPLSLATLPTVAATEKFEHRGDGANSH